MKSDIVVCVLATILLATDSLAEGVMRGDGPAPEARDFYIEKADDRLYDLVSPDAELEFLADGFGLNEGPVWVRDEADGYLIVGGLLDNALYKITPDREVSVFMEYAGYSGDSPERVGTQTRSGRAHVLLIGPACASLDSRGRLVWCAMQDRAVKRLEPDGEVTIVSDGSAGKLFSGPNDLAIAADDSIYLTDNDYGLRNAGQSPDKEMPNGVWLIRDGETKRLLTRTALGGPPNGVALSPDDKYLYLSAGSRLVRCDVKPDGTLGSSKTFSEGPGIGDGVKVDKQGNVYSSGGAGPGIIRIMAADGTFLGALHLPTYSQEPKKQICATNLAFGDYDGKALYITACDAVYRIRMKAEGLLPGAAVNKLPQSFR